MTQCDSSLNPLLLVETQKESFYSVDIHVVHKSMHYRWGHDAVAYPKHIPL